jgi:hypothetical protein
MKPTQTTHGFVMLVPNQPLAHLWDFAGDWTGHARIRELCSEEIETLLAEADHYRLVEARVGAELRWYPRGDYGFWHHHAKLHMRYAASEWGDAETGDRAILLQEQ